jgi:hypothetical protein
VLSDTLIHIGSRITCCVSGGVDVVGICRQCEAAQPGIAVFGLEFRYFGSLPIGVAQALPLGFEDAVATCRAAHEVSAIAG